MGCGPLLQADEISSVANRSNHKAPSFVRIVERQTFKCGGDRQRSFDVCQHGRGVRYSLHAHSLQRSRPVL